MMKFKRPPFVADSDDENRRGNGRLPTSQFAEFETPSGRYVVELVNLSQQGACIRLSNMPIPPLGTAVALHLMDGEVAIGELKWLGRDTAGVEFTQTITTPEAKIELEHLGREMFLRVANLQSKRRSST